jgi:CheY-like chemotaxis protein
VDSPTPARTVVLLVDDAPDNRAMYTEYLTFKGYAVVTANGGDDAIAQAHACRPDVIVLDVRMPDMTGAQALRLLRSEVTFVNVPVAALTAYAFESERAKALADGFDAFLPKPCLPDDLVVAIEGLLRGRRAPQ